jgi:hypothetical protein
VSVQSVEDMALSEVPNFQGRIVTCRKKESSIWMETDLVNIIRVSIVVLN